MLLQLALRKQDAVAQHFAPRAAALHELLAHSAEHVRLLAARALAAVSCALGADAQAALLHELRDSLPGDNRAEIPKKSRFEAVHGSTAAVGLLLAARAAAASGDEADIASHAVTVDSRDVTGSLEEDETATARAQSCAAKLVDLLGSSHAQLATNAALALGHAMLARAVHLPDGNAEAVELSAGATGASAAGARLPLCMQSSMLASLEEPCAAPISAWASFLVQFCDLSK